VAAVNAALFVASIGGFMYILIHNALRRAAVISQAKALPIPGCPVVHTGIEWAQWVPGKWEHILQVQFILKRLFIATIYEGVLFGFALYKSVSTIINRLPWRTNVSTSTGTRQTVYSIVLQDNLLYFFACVCLPAQTFSS